MRVWGHLANVAIPLEVIKGHKCHVEKKIQPKKTKKN